MFLLTGLQGNQFSYSKANHPPFLQQLEHDFRDRTPMYAEKNVHSCDYFES